MKALEKCLKSILIILCMTAVVTDTLKPGVNGFQIVSPWTVPLKEWIL